MTEFNLKKITNLAYILFLTGILSSGFFALCIIASVVIVYLKNFDCIDDFYSQHFNWILKTFWWGLLWLLIGLLLLKIFIGFLILTVDIIWILYRIFHGWFRFLENNVPTANET